MGEASVYDEVNALLREVGLIDQRVIETPGWQVAVASVQQQWEERGRAGLPMGPVAGDTWSRWLHILSHCLEDGHGLSHARCELQLAHRVIAALQIRP